VDVTATILDVAGASQDQVQALSLDGDSLLSLMRGETEDWKDFAFVEHMAHGTDRPRAMVRQGNWKLCYSHGEPPEFELYDLNADPGEFTNLAYGPDHRDVRERLLARVLDVWGDPDRLTGEIVSSQEARLLIRNVMGDHAIF
jgi:choline-sulfatase